MPDPISKELAESMGVSNACYDEISAILGHLPSVEDLSTLLAMWDSNGRQQGLFTWLRGIPHAAEFNEYIYDGQREAVENIKEPRIKECYNIAHSLYARQSASGGEIISSNTPFETTGESIFMVGKVSSQFLNSDYARRYLHMASNPIDMGSEEENTNYIRMILESLLDNNILHTCDVIVEGGLFLTLLASGLPNGYGFDILCAREIRLDAFLFGEESGRFVVSLAERDDDFFLMKMDEAQINCCFLGRTTSGRILIDGYDFGNINTFDLPLKTQS